VHEVEAGRDKDVIGFGKHISKGKATTGI